MESEMRGHVLPQILGAYRANSISGVKAVFLLQMAADEGHFDLDVAERAREVLPQFTIFWRRRRWGIIGLVPAWGEEAIAVGGLCIHLHGGTAPLLLLFTLLLGGKRRRRVTVTDTAHPSK